MAKNKKPVQECKKWIKKKQPNSSKHCVDKRHHFHNSHSDSIRMPMYVCVCVCARATVWVCVSNAWHLFGHKTNYTSNIIFRLYAALNYMATTKPSNIAVSVIYHLPLFMVWMNQQYNKVPWFMATFSLLPMPRVWVYVCVCSAYTATNTTHKYIHKYSKRHSVWP